MADAVTSAFSMLGTAFTWMISNPYCMVMLGIMVASGLVSLIAGIFR